MRFIGVTFLLGVFAASYLPELPASGWCALIIVLLPLGWIATGVHAGLRAVSMFLSGGLWLVLYVHLFAPAALPSVADGQTISVTGQIVSIPHRNSRRSRFDFIIHEVEGNAAGWRGKVRLSWYNPAHVLAAGQQWRLKIKLKPAHGFANPGGFDYEALLFRKSIAATGYVREVASARLLGQSTTLNSLRQSLSEKIRQAMPESRHSGLLVALVTGDKQFIDAQQWRVLTRTGTIHLMAISGLHIGLIYALFFWLGRALWRLRANLCLLRPAQDVAVVIGFAAALVYAAMAGFAIPTQRALIMLGVIVLSVLSRRMSSPLDVLQAALLLVLLLDPLAILSAGFWLSFAAVAVILMSLDSTRQLPAWYRLIKIQWVIALGLLPLTSVFFNQVSLVAPVMNLFAVPLVGFIIVPMALAGAGIVMISLPLAQWVFGLADGLMQILWRLMTVASDSLYAVAHPANVSLWALLCVLLGAGLVLFHRVTAYRIFGLLLLSPLFISATSPVEKNELQLDILDVGQGLAVVVRTAEHVLLYDTGYSNENGFDIGQSVLLPYLWHEGINTLDRVVLSHDDRDHVGGYDSVSKEMEIKQLSVMPGSRYLSANGVACQAGERWQWDGVEFYFLHPQADATGKENNRSCVLKISAAGGSILLTGDIEKRAEKALLLSVPEQLPADIMLAPHHGSATSSTVEFIARVGAKEVVYPVGYRNRWGFPKAEVQARYAKAGVEQWITADTGMLRYRFTASPAGYERTLHRQQHRRFWWQRTQHTGLK